MRQGDGRACRQRIHLEGGFVHVVGSKVGMVTWHQDGGAMGRDAGTTLIQRVVPKFAWRVVYPLFELAGRYVRMVRWVRDG